jgi:hypothetical protein
MEVNQLSPEIWDSLGTLESSNPRNATAQVLTSKGGTHGFACVFMSLDGSAHLLIQSSEIVESPLFKNLKGLECQVLRDHAVSGRERQTYLDLRCADRHYLLPFTRVVQDVASLVLERALEPSLAVTMVVDAWRAFWAPSDSPPLSPSEQRGLIGELVVLEALASAGVSGVAAWSGPDQDRQDFRTSRIAIEVKTCLGRPRRHTIASLDQLAPSADIPLYLVSLVLDVANDGPITLADVADQVLSVLPASENSIFRERLAAAGFTPMHSAAYRQHAYVLDEILCYRVDDTFPRIVRNSFANPLPSSIEGVAYTVNLEGLPYVGLSEVLEAARGG